MTLAKLNSRIIQTLIALIISLVLFSFSQDASAHRPLWGDSDSETISVPNLTTSFATYRDLATSGQVDVYEFSATRGDELYAGINIPAVKGLEEYGVTVALVGPGLPETGENQLPLSPPDGTGALLFGSSISEDFFEPFTQTNYWGRQRIEMTLPQDGTYYLLAWHPQGDTGKYVLDIGRAEIFGPGDLFRFPIWWVRVHAFFGHTFYMVAAALIVALLTALFIWRSRLPRFSSTPQAPLIRTKALR